MFVLVAGLLLPSASESALLADASDVWADSRCEWQEQLAHERQGFEQNPLPLLLWVRCNDDRPPPLQIRPQLERLATELEARILPDLDSLQPSLSQLLDSTDVLMLLIRSAAVTPSDAARVPEATASLRLWRRRLDDPLPHQSTLLGWLEPGQGSLRWERHQARFSSAQVATPTPRSPRQRRQQDRCRLAYWCQSWSATSVQPARRDGDDRLSDAGWQTQHAMAWAQQRSDAELGRCRMQLVWVSLSVLLLAWLLPLQLGRAGLVISLLLLIAAAFAVMQGSQRCREEARQWCFLAQGFWVQDSWHRFAVQDDPAARLRDQLCRHQGRHVWRQTWRQQSRQLQRQAWRQSAGPLLPLLQAHQMALQSGGPPPPWGRQQLVDVMVHLQHHLQELKRLEWRSVRQVWLQRLSWIVVALALMVWLLELRLLPELQLKQIMLSGLFLVWVLQLDRAPLSLSPSRLRRHRRQLQLELQELERHSDLQAEPDLRHPAVRDAITAIVQRIGQEELDLLRDGLEATGWN